MRGAVFAALLTLSTTAPALDLIPATAEPYRRDLVREARLVWGLNAPIATFAAQIEQESRWNPEAVSPVGARGLAQFMPATAAWIGGAYSALGAGDPQNPRWALRALATYNKYLWDRVHADDDCHRAAKMLSAYNGGLKWVYDDERATALAGLKPALWWGNVEKINSGRAAAYFAENRAYPTLILLTREPRYIAAGWGPGLCEV